MSFFLLLWMVELELLFCSLEFTFFLFWHHLKFLFIWLFFPFCRSHFFFGVSILRWTRIAYTTDALTHTILMNNINKEVNNFWAAVILSKRNYFFWIWNCYKYLKTEYHQWHVTFISCDKLCWINVSSAARILCSRVYHYVSSEPSMPI